MIQEDPNTSMVNNHFIIDNKFLPFIVLEGADGVGKTTHTARLIKDMSRIAKAVNDRFLIETNAAVRLDKPIILITENWKTVKAPDYSSATGRAIKKGLFEGFKSELDRTMLYIKDRVEISERIMIDVEEYQCNNGYIADRWTLSEYVYGIQKGTSPKIMCELLYKYEYGVHSSMVSPDFTIVLTADAQNVLDRMIAQRGIDNLDKNESDLEAQKLRFEVYQGVLDCSPNYGLYKQALETICGDVYGLCIDGNTIDEVYKVLVDIIENKLFRLLCSINA